MDNENREKVIKNLEAFINKNNHKVLTVVPIESSNIKRWRHLVLIRSQSSPALTQENNRNVKNKR